MQHGLERREVRRGKARLGSARLYYSVYKLTRAVPALVQLGMTMLNKQGLSGPEFYSNTKGSMLFLGPVSFLQGKLSYRLKEAFVHFEWLLGRLSNPVIEKSSVVSAFEYGHNLNTRDIAKL